MACYRDPFHNWLKNSSIKSCEYLFALILTNVIQSGHNFAHVSTTRLSHVQNCYLIQSLFFIWKQHVFVRDLDYESITALWIGPQSCLHPQTLWAWSNESANNYEKYHYSDVIMKRWRLKSPASRLFTQPFIQAQIKENIKAQRHWPLWGEFTGDRWIPRTKRQWRGNVSIWWRHHAGCPPANHPRA